MASQGAAAAKSKNEEASPSSAKKTGSGKSSELRVPRQKRSKERVDAILQAARELIGEKGSSGLKIQEIASRANVTAGSMYQYFPNKNAIVQALAVEYFERFQKLISESLQKKPESVDEAIKMLDMLFARFISVNKEDVVLRDIWLSVSTDKSLREVDFRTSRENSALLFDAFKHLFPEDHLEDVKRYMLMIVQIAPVAIRLALSGDGSESREYIKVARRLIEVSFRDWAEA